MSKEPFEVPKAPPAEVPPVEPTVDPPMPPGPEQPKPGRETPEPPPAEMPDPPRPMPSVPGDQPRTPLRLGFVIPLESWVVACWDLWGNWPVRWPEPQGFRFMVNGRAV